MDVVSDESKRVAMMEEWKDIHGYEGLYQVSSLGRVRSTRRRGSKGGVLKLSLDAKNTRYYKIRLCKNGKYKAFWVHRLVAQTFIPNPNNYPQVNHKDEDRTNNNIDNLEWCTNKYNSNYGKHNWKNAIANRGGFLWVVQYSLDGNFVRKHKTLTKAAECVAGDASNISAAIHGRINTAYGYKWKLEN